MSAAFSAIMMTGALVLPEVIVKLEFVNTAVPWLKQNYEMLAERARGLLSGFPFT